jgi:glycosyltransferase involved in cell wall biosynthesis
MDKKIALLHRYPAGDIPRTNAAFKYFPKKLDVKTFKHFPHAKGKLFKSILWIFYAPLLVCFRGYHVIYCDDSFPIYPLTVKLFCPKVKVVLRLGDIHLLYYCSGFLYKILHKIEVATWNIADSILCVSDTMRDYVAAKCKDPTKVHTVLDPVDLDNFTMDRKPTKIPTVMSHGVLSANKGYEKLILAAAMLPKVNFVIIGEGEALPQLKRTAGENVEFRGWVPHEQIKSHLATAWVGVAMRTDNPGNQMVVTSPWLQYNALGVPCVASRRLVFEDLKYPYQFTEVDELVALIKKLIEHPDSWKKWVRTKHNARKVAEKIWIHLSAL